MKRTLALLLGSLALSSCGDSGGKTTGPDSTPVSTITLSHAALTLGVGSSQRLVATTRQQDGTLLTDRAITWTTNDSSVASVSTTGLVIALRVGSATITATSEGKTSTAAVTVRAVLDGGFASVATGSAHTCALTAAGTAWCWGRGESGQLGVPAPTTVCNLDAGVAACSMVPVAVGGGRTFTTLTAGVAHNCALTSDGTAYCWGSNSSGQLGDDSLTPRSAPVPVATTLKFASIDAGATHTCALTSSGTAYCWGLNIVGALGDNTTTPRSVPVAVVGGHIFKSIHAGGFALGHTCALTHDGVAYCWGENVRGQLGRGTSPNVEAHPTPAPVTGGLTFASLTVGLGRHSCGIATGGTAYCWGENGFGGLGDGTSVHSSSPVAVTGGLNFIQLAAGGFTGGHTCGRASTGAAYCWGENGAGQLGDATMAGRLQPVAVSGGFTFTSLDAGFRHTCGRASTGIVYCWGSNGGGQLGNNSNLGSPIPVPVAGQE